MAKTQGNDQGGANKRQAKSPKGLPGPHGGETTAGYFRRILGENPKLLNAGSNKETLDRWLQDHPGAKEVPSNVKANLANIKSVLRQQGRRRGQRQEAERAAQPNTTTAAPVRRAGHRLEALEEHIDDSLTLAKNLDREGLEDVIQYLRHARNLVVWKMGR